MLVPKEKKYIKGGTYENRMDITTIQFPDTIEHIEDYAFYGCSNLKEISFSESLKYIGEYAFEGCSSLTRISIPQNVEYIGVGAFRGCKNLQEILVESENTDFASEDGLLYNKKKTILIQCPVNKTGIIQIPKGIKEIQAYAFEDCEGITKIQLR